MFKINNPNKQANLFDVSNTISNKQRKLWNNSREALFFTEIFSKIDESKFSVLYSLKNSRPNVPINQMVGALILKHLYNWTYKDLFQQLNFNLLTRHAIGIDLIDEDVFSEASIFNFQNRLINHHITSGEDLLDNVYRQLTEKQIKEYNVDTTIQRGDSFLIGSNIVNYTRLRLLIEIIRRLVRILNKEDLELVKEILSSYTNSSSSMYIYQVKREDLPREYETLSEVYWKLNEILKDKYEDKEAYEHFVRVIKEHFNIYPNKFVIKSAKELHSKILMSPDDNQATYREKNRKGSKGYVGHISETINTKNEIDLITDLIIEPNNIGDAEILEKRLPGMMERTTDLAEYFIDGQYGSPSVDRITEGKIKLYQKAIRGRRSYANVIRNEEGEDNYLVKCKGGQEIESSKTIQSEDGTYRMKAYFAQSICGNCTFNNECTIRKKRSSKEPKGRVYYFDRKTILAHQRHANMSELEEPKKYSRANVEATIKETKRGMKNGKARIRGKKRISFYLILTVIAINFTRICKKKLENIEFFVILSSRSLIMIRVRI